MHRGKFELLASATRHMADGVVLIRNSDWRIVYANETYERLLGYEPGELREVPAAIADAPGNEALVEELLEALARDGRWSGHTEVTRKDGTTFWCHTTISNFEDSDQGEISVGVIADITETVLAHAERERSESRLREAQTVAHIGSWEWDVAEDVVEWSDELCRIFGFPTGEYPRTYDGYLECVHPDDRDLVRKLVHNAYETLEFSRFEHRVLRTDGTVRYVDARGRVVPDEDGKPARMLGTAQDITELVHARAGRLEAEERFRRAFEDSGMGMALLSVAPGSEGRFIDVNDAICAITGYDRQALLGIDLETLIHPDDLPDHLEGVRALTEGDVMNLQSERRIVYRGGEEQWVALSISLVKNPSGVPLHRLVQMQDVSERKRFEGQLRYLADHDSLTGLFNRRRFVQELEREIASARRYQTGGALLVLDLDNFKYMNDSAGHAVGDELIRGVASALREKLRETDYLARLGGDEFAVLLPHATVADAVTVAENLLEVVSAGVTLVTDRGPRRTSASIGVAVFGDLAHRASAEQLLIEADVAMYEAKEAGRDRLVVYKPDEDRRDAMEQRLTWSNRINQALEEDRFVLYAQPIVPLGESEASIERYELLLRMVGDDGDLIPPSTFLFVAERFGLIEAIDRWVVRNAISTAAERNRGGTPTAVSVNLSAKSIGNTELVDVIRSELDNTGIDPSLLVFEVTETAAIERIDNAKQFARALRSLGCQLAIDDFGSGFATFYYLKHLEFDVLKIDGEFVKNLPRSTTDQLVVRSLADIAKGLGKRTIAEFVGDEATLEVLRRFGVDFAQGFHVGRAGPLSGVSTSRPESVGVRPSRS